MIKKIRHTKYIMGDLDGKISLSSSKVNKKGVELEERIKVMPRFSLYRKANKLNYLEKLISDLTKNEDMILPAFLLRAQFIELALKYLLLNYPYPPENGYGKKPVEEMNMGNIIYALKKCNDSHLEEIIIEADKFRTIRNDLTHNVLTLDKNVDEINKLAKEKINDAYKIEKSILFFLTYVEEIFSEDQVI